jgi:hypothetical protein
VGIELGVELGLEVEVEVELGLEVDSESVVSNDSEDKLSGLFCANVVTGVNNNAGSIIETRLIEPNNLLMSANQMVDVLSLLLNISAYRMPKWGNTFRIELCLDKRRWITGAKLKKPIFL